VLIAHVGGNPDRPIIVGTLPHGKMTSPITSVDAAKARIRSAGDVLIEIDDSST
jgi:type VI secretion system secreted protein VgrG